MPAFGTHLIFGQQTYKKLDKGTVKDSIYYNRKLFYLGLQGPDIFFFYPGSVLINKKNIGSVMHRTRVSAFLKNMICGIRNYGDKDRKKLVAYISGMMGHYFLDSTVHPYIFYFSGYYEGTKEYHNQHAEFEYELDYVLCQNYLNKSVFEMDYKRFVDIKSEHAHLVGEKLANAIRKTYDVRISEMEAFLAIKSFKPMMGLFNDKHGIKKKVIKTGEKLILGHEHQTPLMAQREYIEHIEDILNCSHREWINPWDEDNISIESFVEIYSEAMSKYINAICMLEKYIDGECEIEEVMEIIGNKSYVTGLEALDSLE